MRFDFVLACACLLAACATPRPQAPATTFLVVRHAEKAEDGTRDPPLSPAGEARARRLASAVRGEAVVAVYATAFRRTQHTVLPTATAHGLGVTTYDAGLPAAALAARLRAAHRAGTVLVVGHSNTAPQLAAALCGCAATPLADGDYGRVYRVRVDGDGHAQLQESELP
jgi:broad specificity phosphatase PhoE